MLAISSIFRGTFPRKQSKFVEIVVTDDYFHILLAPLFSNNNPYSLSHFIDISHKDYCLEIVVKIKFKHSL